MWNLFSTVQPKVTKPSRSLKQQLLIQQAYNLQDIQDQSKNILNAINSTLKNISTNTFSEQNAQSSFELQNILTSLEKKLIVQNIHFSESLNTRDQEKENQQQFFKATMKSYEAKKTDLNKYIKDLQQKVQKLQMLGLKTYSLNPDQDQVLSGFNQKYIVKYLSKLSLINDISQDIENIQKKNNKATRRLSLTSSSRSFSSETSPKLSLFQTFQLCDSLQGLQKQLQMILINQEVIGTMLSSRLKKHEKQFQRLASQQKSLKLGLNKLHQQSEKRAKQKQKAVTINEKEKIQKPQSPKQSSMLSKSTGTEKVKKLDVSFSDSIEQKVIQEQPQNLNSAQKNKIQQGQQLIPSKNFLNACQDLITKTFLQDDQKQ